MAGLLSSPGRPTIAPQRLGTTVQSSNRLGRIASFRPTTIPIATIAPAAGNSSGHETRSAMSTSHGRTPSGSSFGASGWTGSSTRSIAPGTSGHSAGQVSRPVSFVGQVSRPVAFSGNS